MSGTNNANSNGNGNGSDHQTYAGYLKKQGALFKQWKERYFVLDSVKHQVCSDFNDYYYYHYIRRNCVYLFDLIFLILSCATMTPPMTQSLKE
jgi:hypothetical protein